MRLCTQCGDRKEDKLFGRISKFKNTGMCRLCQALSSNLYYKNNKEKNKTYRDRNKEKIRKYSAEYRNRTKLSRKQYKVKNRDSIAKKDKIYRNTNKEKILKYREENKSKIDKWNRDYSKEYSKNNRNKARAKDAVRRALKSGELKKEPCLACLVQDKKVNYKNTDGHHTDYTRSLNVVWLCRSHHMLVHKLIKQNEDKT